MAGLLGGELGSAGRARPRRHAHAAQGQDEPDAAGLLAQNGVPYSENATLEEYYDRFTEPNGDDWLVVTSIVTDAKYLTQPYVTTNHFRKIPDKQGWDPTPCRADQAR